MATRTKRGANRAGAGRNRANRDGRMSLGQHLLELRKRLFIAAIAIIVVSIGGWFLQPYVLTALRAPIAVLAGAHRAANLNYTNISEAFDVRIQIAFVIGIVASSPIWLYQVLAFLVPGLTRREKRYTFGFLFTAIPLFLIGCAAGWFIFPHIVGVLGSFVPAQDTALIGARDYLGFVLKLVLAVGVAFVLPVFLVLLNFMSILSGRTIIRSWRWAILLIFVFCALATPSADVGSMFILAVPMIVLYLAAALISLLHDRSVARRADSLSDGLPSAGDPAAA